MSKRALMLFILTFLGVGGAEALPIVYVASLSGPAESPPVASPGTGFTTVTIDTTAHTLQVEVSFSDLVGTTTAAHIHCCTAVPNDGNVGVATPTPSFPLFPVGVTSGSYDEIFDLTDPASFNAAFVTANGGTAAGAEAALAQGLAEGRAYLNIHTSAFGGGEIRGFLAVPEPASLPLLGAGLLLMAVRQRKGSLERL